MIEVCAWVQGGDDSRARKSRVTWLRCPRLRVRLHRPTHLHVLGPNCWPPLSGGATVCFYRWLQKLLLWPAVIPGHKSQTPAAKQGWMRQQIRSLKQVILHSIFPAVQVGPQSAHLSSLLLSFVCCLLLEQHHTEASEGEKQRSHRAPSVDSVARLTHTEALTSLCLSTHALTLRSCALD